MESEKCFERSETLPAFLTFNTRLLKAFSKIVNLK
jgi:hypothetical protein